MLLRPQAPAAKQASGTRRLQQLQEDIRRRLETQRLSKYQDWINRELKKCLSGPHGGMTVEEHQKKCFERFYAMRDWIKAGKDYRDWDDEVQLIKGAIYDVLEAASLAAAAMQAGMQVYVAFNPILGTFEVITGEDVITGEKLTPTGYIINAAGLVIPVISTISDLRGGVKATDRFVDATRHVEGGKAIRVMSSAAGRDVRPMIIVREIAHGEKVVDLVGEIKSLTWTSGGLEHAVVKLADGRRVIVSGGADGIEFVLSDIRRIFGHTHPTNAPPSASDIQSLIDLGQSKQYVFHGGQISIVRRP